jgi:chromosome segregation ATPase
VLFVAQFVHAVPVSRGSWRFIYSELQSNFDVVMSQNATLSGELDALRESLTRLQSSANQALADLSEKEAELRIQKRERFECESKLYAAAAEHDRMKEEALAAAARLLQVSQPLPPLFRCD